MEKEVFSEKNLTEWRKECVINAQHSYDHIGIPDEEILYGWIERSYINNILPRTLRTDFDPWPTLAISTRVPEEPAIPSEARSRPSKFLVYLFLSTLSIVAAANIAPALLGVAIIAVAVAAIPTFVKSQTYKEKMSAWTTLVEHYAHELDEKRGSQKYSNLVGEASDRQLKEYADEIWLELSSTIREENEQRQIDSEKFKKLYEDGDKLAICQFAGLLLISQPRPAGFPREINLTYKTAEKMMVIEYILPSPDSFEKIKQSKWVQLKYETKLKVTDVPTKQIRKIYNDVAYELQLAAIQWLFFHDDLKHIQSVILNGWIDYTHKGTGKEQRSCITSLQVTRDQFATLDMGKVSAKDCFRYLKGIGSPELYDVVPIPPIMQVNKEDRRFIAAHDVAGSLNEGVNLASMDWKEFEQLVRQIFEQRFSKDGIEVKVTQSSRDKGVDAIAIDPDPIRGGRIVIQAKRYSNTVDVSAVRDLYGTVLNEGATKGILVTTSGFGPDAYEFCKGKPLTLISGGEFLQILLEEGYKAHIDMQEAKKLLRATV